MINRIINFTIIPIILLSLTLLVSVYFFHSSDVVNVLSFGITIGFFTVILAGYLSPSQWLFKSRFWFFGSIFGGLIFVQNFDFGDFHHTEEILVFVSGAILIGNTFFGGSYLWYFRELRKNTPLIMRPNEYEIASDIAFVILNKKKSGRLILTNHRLSFITNDRGRSQYDFFLNELGTTPEIIYRLGIPSRIKLKNEKTSFQVIFPRYWKKQMNKIINAK